jgi:RHS repeat-associated protein
VDYADQRYYASAYGRFNTPDPYQATDNGGIDANTPESWNRYAYVLGDPVNYLDPMGLFGCQPQFCEGNSDGDGDDSDGPLILGPQPDQLFGPNVRSLTVSHYSRTGTNESAIANALTLIQNNILSGKNPCSSWLAGVVGGFSASEFIAAIMGSGPSQYTFGYGLINSPTTAAFVGNTNANGTPVAGLPGDATITINSNGAFFNSGQQIGGGGAQYQGGSIQAQVFILLHELAHEVGAAGFQADNGNNNAETSNNNLVQKNCGKQIAGLP